MRKLFSSIVAVALLVLALNSCENFLNSNLDVREKIAEEVTISKASPVNVSVIAKAGTGEVSKSSVTAKVGVPFVVEFYAAKDEKFLNWAAFENYDDTKTLADQLGPSVIQYRKVDNQAVEGSTESKVEITIMKDVGQITLVPWCATTVNVAVIAKTGTGSVSSSAVAAKVGVPFIVEFYAEDGSEFLRWAAFENYDDTKTLDDQLGSSVIQYRKVDNSSMDGASEAKVEITIIKDVGQITLVPWCGTRPRVTTTEPVNYSTNVVRTTPIKIRFSKAIDESCIATAENPDAYKNYFELYMRRSASADEEAVDYAEYFESPVIKSSREIWFNCKAKTDESRWLPAGSIIRFVVKGSLKDADGVKFGDSTSVEFTLGAKGDVTGPIVTVSEFKNGTRDIRQTVFGNWEPRSGAAYGVHYADTECRVNGNGSFSMKVKADDSTTGDTGLMGFSVIQRLVYVPKGGYLPGTDDEVASSDMIPFDEGKTKWNYLSGILESDFKKETVFEFTSENTDFEKTFEIDEGFRTTSGKAVDGIYMFEVTALDGNSNYASNPSYYYVVRDTTAPDGKANAAKITIDDTAAGNGIIVKGKRFFGKNYRNVKFKAKGSILDSGTQGQPWVANRPAECKWNVALSTSATEFTPSNMASNWSLDGSVEIKDNYLDVNRILYVWAKFTDKYGFESTPVCVPDTTVYCDVESPDSPVRLESDDYLINTDVTPNIVYVKSTPVTINFSCTDTDSTNQSLITNTKVYYKNSSSSPLEMILQNDVYCMTLEDLPSEEDELFSIFAVDSLGNISEELNLKIKGSTNPAELAITNLENYYSKGAVYPETTDIHSYKVNNGIQKTVGCYRYLDHQLMIPDRAEYPPAYTDTLSLRTIVNDVVYFRYNLFLQFMVNETEQGIEKIKFSDNVNVVPGQFIILQDDIEKTSDFIYDSSTHELICNLDERDKENPYIFKMKISTSTLYGNDQISISVVDSQTVQTETKRIFKDNVPPNLNYFADTVISSNEMIVDEAGHSKTVSLSSRIALTSYNSFRSWYSASDDGIDNVYFAICKKDTTTANDSLYIYSKPQGSYYYLPIESKREFDYLYIDPNSTYKDFMLYTKTAAQYKYTVIAYDALGNASTLNLIVQCDSVPPELKKYGVDSTPGSKTVGGISYTNYKCYKNTGAGFVIEDSGCGLEYAMFKALDSSDNVIDVIDVVSGVPVYLKDLNNGSGTKYTAYMVDKWGYENTKTFYVTDISVNTKPEFSNVLARGIGYAGNIVTGYYKDDVRLVFRVEAEAGLKENGITFPSSELYKYRKAHGASGEDVEGDYIPVELGENPSTGCTYYAYLTLKGKDVIVKAEDTNGKTAYSSTTLERDTIGPQCDYTPGANTTLVNPGSKSKFMRRMDDNGVYHAGDYVKCTSGTPTVKINLSDAEGVGSDKTGGILSFPAGGGIYPLNKGLVTKADNTSYTNDPVWDSSSSSWVLTIPTKNTEYVWYAYDALGNITELRFKWQ